MKERVNEDLRTAMKARDKDRTSVLRMVLSELKYAQAAINMSVELADDEATKVIASYHKRLSKSLDDYPEGERRDAIRKELVIVAEYLPKKAGLDEMTKMVDQVIAAATDKTFGPLMKEVMARLGSSADGKVVSQLLKQRLANS